MMLSILGISRPREARSVLTKTFALPLENDREHPLSLLLHAAMEATYHESLFSQVVGYSLHSVTIVKKYHATPLPQMTK